MVCSSGSSGSSGQCAVSTAEQGAGGFDRDKNDTTIVFRYIMVYDTLLRKKNKYYENKILKYCQSKKNSQFWLLSLICNQN